MRIQERYRDSILPKIQTGLSHEAFEGIGKNKSLVQELSTGNIETKMASLDEMAKALVEKKLEEKLEN